MNKTIRGSCLCGGVRFEVEPPFIRANHELMPNLARAIL